MSAATRFDNRLRSSLSLTTRWLALFAALAVTPGCGGHPKNVLTPVADTAPTSSRVTMLIATTRGRSEHAGEMFTGERARAPAFADMTVSIPPVRKVGEVAWPKRLPSNPVTDFATLNADDLSRDEANTWLNATVRKSPDRSVLIFIHGFNNRFEDAVYRFAQIVSQCQGVSEAAVIGIKDDKWSERPLAFVVRDIKTGDDLSDTQIKAHLKSFADAG
ncbi:alpha/beta hydrolase [Rhizobium giardinii]